MNDAYYFYEGLSHGFVTDLKQIPEGCSWNNHTYSRRVKTESELSDFTYTKTS